jgi:hypothetical protein
MTFRTRRRADPIHDAAVTESAVDLKA